jgi:hypothetical protein
MLSEIGTHRSNMMAVDQIDDAQQEKLAKQLQDNGAKAIRTSLGGHGDLHKVRDRSCRET